MKLVYILNQRFPTEKAYGIQVAQMSKAFAAAGIQVELLVPSRTSKEGENPFAYYGISPEFQFTKISSPDWYLPGPLDKISFWFKNIISAQRLARAARDRQADIIYSREELPLMFLLKLKAKLVLEIHRYSSSRAFLYRILSKRGVRFIAVTDGLRKDLISSGIPSGQILTAHDGVDLTQFGTSILKEDARRELNLPLDKKIIMYTGHLYERKGAEVLASAAQSLKDALIVFVGGTNAELASFKKRWGHESNIMIAGRQSHDQIPLWLQTADILVLPSLPDDGQEYYTSPLKLFEYMASRRVIVASDLPSLREVLNDDEAEFFAQGSVVGLVNAIKKVLDSYPDEKVDKAWQKVQKYSWVKRAQNILSFIR